MKCPNWGRFSKVKISDDDKINIYSDCSYCGLINIVRNDIEKVTEKETDYLKIALAAFSIILLVTSVFLYIKLDEGNSNNAYDRSIIEEGYIQLNNSYYSLRENYLILLNTSSSLEDYYIELQEMYSTFRSEYSDLEDLYLMLAQEKADLVDDKNSIQRELDDMLSFSKRFVLESDASYAVPAGRNMTLSYDITYAGFIEVNFTSFTDIYIWVGSSISENGYYARYPAFPQTAYNGTFTVPVCFDVYLFIVNTSTDSGTNVTLTIEYTY